LHKFQVNVHSVASAHDFGVKDHRKVETDMLKHNADREKILHLLEEAGGVTEQVVAEISAKTGVPEADIWGAGKFYSLINRPGERVRVCDGLTCQMFGAQNLMDTLKSKGVEYEAVSCLGQCDRAPVQLETNLELQSFSIQTQGITPDNADLPMNLAGPQDLTYAALRKVRSLQKDQILDEIETSGLQGRGGAGFPAHFKWRSVASQPVTERYVVCNADEGEPGTFKDREIILRQPHKMLEGLAIAAHTIGAQDIYLYIRGEFTAERRSLERAIEQSQSEECGHALSEFRIHVVCGHGAYSCGEETALLESLEGRRGMPRLKPPFPTVQGFRNKPTLMHNVETAACVGSIVLRGGSWFKQLGKTEAGSKLYCISGHVKQPGVYEMPLGICLEDLVAAAGGYEGTPVAFSPGGASSGFLPIRFHELPLDYKNLAEAGSMLGSAGVVVLNDTVDLVQAALWQLEFFERESCGQCAPCRIGTQYLRQRLQAFLESKQKSNLQYAEDVGWEMEEGSICGLGMVAAKPLESLRKHFPELFA